jgi:putative colanic acid biosynthesis UDP-glucose lipid carrier transferase
MSVVEISRETPQGRADGASARVAGSRGKRAFDLGVAVLALLTLLPLLLVIALVVRVESRGPVMFRQLRTGLNGRAFAILKFRTMYVAEDGDEVRQACRGDSRVTRCGQVLRKLSFDELPQLINVLKGEMSIVGPRPHALRHDEQWAATVPGYTARFRARPGLTGYAQVSGYRGEVRDLEAIRGRITADNRYIEDWSLLTDARLVLRTIPLIFRDPTAY